MKTLLVVFALAFATANAFAAASVKPTYILNGKTVAAEKALMAAINGQEVLACKPVEAKLSKSGTSFGLRNKKAAEQVATK